MKQNQKTRPNNLYYLNAKLHHRGDRDPDLEEICHMIDSQGLLPGDVVKRVYDITNGVVNLHYKTIEKWLNGKTKKPLNYTLNWVGIALGFERRWTKR